MCPRLPSDAGLPARSPRVCSAGHKTGPRCAHLLFAAPPGHKNGLPCARLPHVASLGHKNGLLCAHLLLGAGGKDMVSMRVLCRGGLPPAGGRHPQQRVPAVRPGRRCENGVRPGGRATPTTPEEAPAVLHADPPATAPVAPLAEAPTVLPTEAPDSHPGAPGGHPGRPQNLRRPSQAASSGRIN